MKYLFLVAFLIMYSFVVAETKTSTSWYSRKVPVGGEWAIGIRASAHFGASVKKFGLKNKHAFELQIGLPLSINDPNRIIFLYEKLAPLNKNKRLSSFVGCGVSASLNPDQWGLPMQLGFDWRLTDQISMQVDAQMIYEFKTQWSTSLAYTLRYHWYR